MTDVGFSCPSTTLVCSDVEFREVDCRRAGPDCRERRCPQAAGKNADLEALEIRRCCDRACSRGDLPESQRPSPIEYLEANVADASSDVIAHLAVHGRPDL